MEAIDKIGIKHIRYFLAVADHGSFRQAAFKLNTTQPSLSNLITGLEETLGVKLFERNRRGTHITPAGRELLANARRVLEETQGMMDRADTISGGGFGTHRLGVTPTLGPYLLPHILPLFTDTITACSCMFGKSRPVISRWDWSMVSMT
ncbi:MAG: LysR family transcriptional regulator [Pseudohongiellaceae bacterium]